VAAHNGSQLAGALGRLPGRDGLGGEECAAGPPAVGDEENGHGNWARDQAQAEDQADGQRGRPSDRLAGD